MNGIPTLFLVTGGMIALLFFVVYASQRHDLNSIRDRTVGHGQHGTARWATAQEVKRTYHHVPFTPDLWRIFHIFALHIFRNSDGVMPVRFFICPMKLDMLLNPACAAMDSTERSDCARRMEAC